MAASYDSWLVALSIVVAVIASYVALDLASRVAATQGSRAARYWLLGGALSMGTGIWSMHFIGMLAFRLPIAMAYDLTLTLLSLVIAICVSGFALYTVSHGVLQPRRLLLAGLLMGLGIAGMHYTGMAAMKMSPPIRYDPLLFTLSIAIAIAASLVALWIAFQLRLETILSAFWKKTGSALAMGAAIAGMHYTAMAAANFAADSVCLSAAQNIDNVWLGSVIGGFAFLLLTIALLVSTFDAHLADRSAKLAETMRQANQRLQQEIAERIDAEGRLLASFTELKAVHEELQQAQSQLLQSEKMASIGQLAAGVAHEINNPIGFVNSNFSTLQEYIEDLLRLLDRYQQLESALPAAQLDEIARLKRQLDVEAIRGDILALLAESREGTSRVMQIVRDLKNFSRVGDDQKWQRSDLHAGLDSTLNIVQNELKYKAEVVKEYGPLPAVECLPSQLNQVFMNLLVNAGQAITVRGKVTISTGCDGSSVWVRIGDNGPGIAPENLKRIFDPFFTTKPVGQGTGLGLSMSYGIVAKHHGRIEVASAPGQGSTFCVWLPIDQPPPAAIAS